MTYDMWVSLVSMILSLAAGIAFVWFVCRVLNFMDRVEQWMKENSV